MTFQITWKIVAVAIVIFLATPIRVLIWATVEIILSILAILMVSVERTAWPAVCVSETKAATVAFGTAVPSALIVDAATTAVYPAHTVGIQYCGRRAWLCYNDQQCACE